MKESFVKKSLVIGVICLLMLMTISSLVLNGVGMAGVTKEASANFPLTTDYTNAFWKFDENSGNIAHDSSGHNYDGTIYGASWTSGYSGFALLFDGASDYVDLDAHARNLGFNKTDDLIFSFWFKSSSYNLGRIYSTSTSIGTNPEIQIFLAPNGTLGFKAVVTSCGFTLYTNNAYNNNVWHYVEIWYNGITNEPTVSIYVDNILNGTITAWVCPFYNDEFTRTKIGRRSNDSTGYFNGKIDEFKIIKFPGGNGQDPPNITGPTNGKIGVKYDFTFVANDPEGDNVWYYIDWDDGMITDWFGPYPSGQEVTKSHTWYENGTYDIRAQSKDVWHHSSWGHHTIVIGNIAPYAPTITGPISGEIGETLSYKFKAIDYDTDDVLYYIDWGDGTHEDWFGPYNSGQEITRIHAWDLKSDYNITAKAKDIYGNEGDWSEPFDVRIGDQPPGKPIISGPTTGKPGIEYDFTVVAIDPEGDNVSYYIDWGDGTTFTSSWYDSGFEVTFSHTWVNKGTFAIRARAKDVFDKVGDWKTFIFTVKNLLSNQQSFSIPSSQGSQQQK